jgi:hypothetical protein
LGDLHELELQLTKQKVEALREELARQAHSAKMDSLDKQIAVVQQLQSPRRMSPLAPRRI